MKKIFLRLVLCLILPIYSIAVINVSAANVNITTEAVYSATQTMDIGIITGIIALSASALIIYILRKRRR